MKTTLAHTRQEQDLSIPQTLRRAQALCVLTLPESVTATTSNTLKKKKVLGPPCIMWQLSHKSVCWYDTNPNKNEQERGPGSIDIGDRYLGSVARAFDSCAPSCGEKYSSLH